LKILDKTSHSAHLNTMQCSFTEVGCVSEQDGVSPCSSRLRWWPKNCSCCSTRILYWRSSV